MDSTVEDDGLAPQLLKETIDILFKSTFCVLGSNAVIFTNDIPFLAVVKGIYAFSSTKHRLPKNTINRQSIQINCKFNDRLDRLSV